MYVLTACSIFEQILGGTTCDETMAVHGVRHAQPRANDEAGDEADSLGAPMSAILNPCSYPEDTTVNGTP